MNSLNAEHTSQSAPASAGAGFKRWLIISQYYHPESGAAAIRLHALVRELLAHGCDVQVITALPNYPNGRIYPEYRGMVRRQEVVDGAKVERYWLYAAAGRHPFARLLCYLSFTLVAIIRSLLIRKPDVIFVEAQPLSLAAAGYVNRLLRQVPYIYNTPDLQVEVARENGWLRWKWATSMAEKLEAFFMKRSFCVSTVSNAFVDHFVATRGVSRTRVTFLPNGADASRLQPLLADRDYAAELGVDGKIVFTYAGTHSDYHGTQVLVDAARLLRDRKDITILVTGQGSERGRLEDRARALGSSNILFRHAPFGEMERLMSVTRASVATLRDFPSARKMRLAKVIPSLACGVPVVYVGRGESAEMLRRYGCGQVIDEPRAEDLSAVLRHLADNRLLCQEMGRRGRRLVEQELTWKTIVERWLAQVDSIRQGRDPWERRWDGIDTAHQACVSKRLLAQSAS